MINTLKKLVKTIDYDIYKNLFVNPEDKETANNIIKELLAILNKTPKGILNSNYTKFIKFLDHIWKSRGNNFELSISFYNKLSNELSSDLYDIIEEAIFDVRSKIFNSKKEFINCVLEKPQYSFYNEFVKKVE